MVRVKYVGSKSHLTSKKLKRPRIGSGDKKYRVPLWMLARYGRIDKLRVALPKEYDMHLNPPNKYMPPTTKQENPNQRLNQWIRTLSSVILEACSVGNPAALRIVLNVSGKFMDVLSSESVCVKRYLLKAIESQSSVCVRFVIDAFLRDKEEEYFATNNYSELLVVAARIGNADVVKELLCICDGTYKSSLALRTAVQHGHTDCVRELVNVSVPSHRFSEALREAAYQGLNDIFDILLPMSDPKARRSEALRWCGTTKSVLQH